MMNLIIKLMGFEDYYFTISKRSKHNSSGKLELHTLNSDGPIAVGFGDSLREINAYRRSR